MFSATRSVGAAIRNLAATFPLLRPAHERSPQALHRNHNKYTCDDGR